MADHVHEVSDQSFEQDVLQSDKPTLIDFWAPWCGPCRVIGPIIEELAPSYEGKAKMVKMNVDDNPGVAQRFQVTAIPTLIIFKNGQVADRAVGLLPKNELKKFIERNL